MEIVTPGDLLPIYQIYLSEPFLLQPLHWRSPDQSAGKVQEGWPQEPCRVRSERTPHLKVKPRPDVSENLILLVFQIRFHTGWFTVTKLTGGLSVHYTETHLWWGKKKKLTVDQTVVELSSTIYPAGKLQNQPNILRGLMGRRAVSDYGFVSLVASCSDTQCTAHILSLDSAWLGIASWAPSSAADTPTPSSLPGQHCYDLGEITTLGRTSSGFKLPFIILLFQDVLAHTTTAQA